MTIPRIGFVILLSTLTISPVIPQTLDSTSGSVEGIVVNKTDGSSLNSVSVLLSSNSPQKNEYRVATKPDGTFAFKNIAPGHFNLSATLAGYLQPNLAASTSTIEVAARQSVRKVRIQLVRQASISGRIAGDKGPIAGVTVSAMFFEYDKNGSLGLQPANAASGAKFAGKTDERGEYRIFPLLPGEYFLWVNPADQQYFYPTYYPGVTDPQSAMKLFVTDGSELSRIDFHVSSGQRYSIRLIPASLAPIPGRVSFQMRSRGKIREQNLLTSKSASINEKDGSYTIKEIPPGSYDIFMGTGARGVTQKLPVEITDHDLDLGTVLIKPGISISGKVKFSEPPTSTTVAIDPFPILEGFPKSTVVGEDGSFRFDNVSDGQYRIFVRTAKNDQFIASAKIGSLDVSATGFIVDSSRPISELEIQLAGPPGRVEGIMQTRKGDPIRGARVVVFPFSGPRENPEVFRAGSTDQDGHFLIDGVPPGNYGVLGWEYLPGEAYKNAEFLKPFEALAEKVLVASGATSRVNIHD
jgi:hypothetical protein